MSRHFANGKGPSSGTSEYAKNIFFAASMSPQDLKTCKEQFFEQETNYSASLVFARTKFLTKEDYWASRCNKQFRNFSESVGHEDESIVENSEVFCCVLKSQWTN